MRALFRSDFFLRFTGGFTLGAVAMAGLRPDAAVTLTAWLGTVAHIA